ncbi:transglycosylase family protein [Sanguibacter sp. YZGR15]|uniref:Transglycosylase family protein n=1 Tax=Sanguibacter suaedae TaxID=2795737 RepID=A0A934I313_9MICO|nr:transglycosylase family protein [Sanguibacter suaedae]
MTGGVALALVGAGSAVYATAHKTVTLDVDGEIQTVTTFSGSVESLLEENGVTVSDGDVVAPSGNAKLSEGSDVVVRYAREITIMQDGETSTTTTTAVDADEFLAAFADRGDAVHLVASRSDSAGRADIGLRLSLDGPVTLRVDGEDTEVEDGSVGLPQILEDHDVTLGTLDRLSVQHLPTEAALAAQARAEKAGKVAAEEASSAGTAPAEGEPTADASAAPEAGKTPDVIEDPTADETRVTVVIERVVVAEEAVEHPIPFESVTEEDATRFEDLPVVTRTEGVAGVRTEVFSVTTVDGVEESRELVSDGTTVEPVTEVLVQGTKERPVVVAPRPKSPSTSTSSSGGSTAAAPAAPAPAAPVVTGDVWGQLAQCESGGNPSIVSSNGLYHGLYQFSVGTWQSVGGSGLPSQASPEEQTQRAQALQARSGWGQWPHCSSKLGLR